MIRLVLTDLDRTFLPNGREVLESEDLDAIRSLMDAGVMFGPVSGRSLEDVQHTFQGDTSCLRNAIVSNGKMVFANGRMVYMRTFGRETIEGLVLAAASIGRLAVNLRSATGQSVVLACTQEELDKSRWSQYVGGPVVAKLPSWAPVTATVLMLDDTLPAEQIRVSLEERVGDVSLLVPGPGMFDVVPRGYTKADAVRILLRELGVKPEELVVFGDSENDLDLMRVTTLSVAVSNAIPEVRRVARYHIGSCDDAAVRAALKDIAKTAPWGELPAFMREEDAASAGPRAELGAPLLQQSASGHPAVKIVVGIAIIFMAALAYAVADSESFASVLLIVIGALLGAALLYSGVADRHDRRPANKKAAH